MFAEMFGRVREIFPVATRTLFLVRSWEHQRCYVSPIRLLDETLAEFGVEGYNFLLEEMFRVLKKKIGIHSGKPVHLVVRPGFSFWPYPAVRPGEDSMQWEGSAIIHHVRGSV